MRKIRQVLRLAWEAGLVKRQIARSLSMSPTTVAEYLRRAEQAGLSWPLPDWAEIHQALKGKGMTLLLLWQEYKAVYPEGLQYSQFCDRYRFWVGKLDVVMRQRH